jgi:hypothetical protein
MNPLLRDSNGDGLDDILVIYIIALDVDERPDNYRHVVIICSQISNKSTGVWRKVYTAYNYNYLPVDRGLSIPLLKKLLESIALQKKE